MLDWYRRLGADERRTFWACFGGWALDALDVQIYSFVIPALIAVWSITRGQAGLLATSALVISAFGGWIAGVFADRVGRARLLSIMIAWFAFFTFLSGFTQSFEQLLVVRGLQGFGFGGEWAAGSVLMGEVVRGADRGKAVGTVQSAWALGWGAAAILATLIFQIFPQEIAWRSLFFVGILPALLVFYIRTRVREPAIFRAAIEKAERRGPWTIFQRELLPTTILGAALSAGAQGGYYAITTFLPTFLRTERHLTVLGSGFYLAIIIIGSWCGYIASAYWSDMIGRRKNFFIFAIGSLVIAVAYTEMQISELDDAPAGISARLLRVRHFQRHGSRLHGALSDQRARGGPGLLLQFRPGPGRIVPRAGRCRVSLYRARPSDRSFRGHRLRRRDSRRARAAGNARKRIAGGLKDGRY